MIILLGTIVYILIGCFIAGFLGFEDSDFGYAPIIVILWPVFVIILMLMLSCDCGKRIYELLNRRLKRRNKE